MSFDVVGQFLVGCAIRIARLQTESHPHILRDQFPEDVMPGDGTVTVHRILDVCLFQYSRQTFAETPAEQLKIESPFPGLSQPPPATRASAIGMTP